MKLFDFDKLINTLTGYIETKIELLKIDIREGMSVVITKLVVFGLLAFLGLFVLIFLFLGLAHWVNLLLESTFLGYFAVAAFFAIGLFLVLISRDKIMVRVSQEVEKLTEEDKTEQDV